MKQQLKGYELSEFAHIENVLVGETRSRTHRRLDIQEQERTFLEEREATTERNLEQTTRSEMQNEVNATLRSESEIEGGAAVSVKYGRVVQF